MNLLKRLFTKARQQEETQVFKPGESFNFEGSHGTSGPTVILDSMSTSFKHTVVPDIEDGVYSEDYQVDQGYAGIYQNFDVDN